MTTPEGPPRRWLDAVDSCPNLYLNGKRAVLWINGQWVNVWPGPPPLTEEFAFYADPENRTPQGPPRGRDR